MRILNMISIGVEVTTAHATMWRYQDRDTAAPGMGPFLAAVCMWGSLQTIIVPRMMDSEQSGQRFMMMVSDEYCHQSTICNLYCVCCRPSSGVWVFRWQYNRVPVWHRVSPLGTWGRLLALPLQPSPGGRGRMWLWAEERSLWGGPGLYWWLVSRDIIFKVSSNWERICRDPCRQWVLDTN